jgi:histone H3
MEEGVDENEAASYTKENAKEAPSKKRRRNKSGTVAKREIRKLQKSTDFLIPKDPFQRLVREIAQQCGTDHTRFSVGSMTALQEACETFVTERFQRAENAMVFAGRRTLDVKDLEYTQ